MNCTHIDTQVVAAYLAQLSRQELDLWLAAVETERSRRTAVESVA